MYTSALFLLSRNGTPKSARVARVVVTLSVSYDCSPSASPNTRLADRFLVVAAWHGQWTPVEFVNASCGRTARIVGHDPM